MNSVRTTTLKGETLGKSMTLFMPQDPICKMGMTALPKLTQGMQGA